MGTMDSQKSNEEIPEEVRAYMSRLGSKRTPAKLEAVRVNAARGAQARRKDPLTVPCTCSGGDSLKACDHKTTCQRGNLLYQRERTAAQS